jgi:hypothetical protein
MKPDIDPSLRAAEPPLDSLDDGFSPPPPVDEQPAGEQTSPMPAERTLGAKSPF